MKQPTQWPILSSMALGATLLLASCGGTKTETSATTVTKFEPTIESLQQYQTPEWFRDAKFGIYIHWGAYSVAEEGEWYARNMYIQGNRDYKYHVEHYGHPSKFGYKDFIPMWKAENFQPDSLLALFKQAGAKYFTPCAVHHDNFDLWDSKYHRWNAVDMGPKKDLIGIFRKATLKAGLRFGCTTHLSRSYSWFNTANQSDKTGPLAGVPYDGDNPELDDFYHKKHADTDLRAPKSTPKEWRETWEKRIGDLIDNYHPDFLYFDCAIPFRGEDRGETGMRILARLYNDNMAQHGGKQEAVMCIKERPWQGLYAPGMATLDYERGKASSILAEPWQTDDSMGSWGYDKKKPYMSTDATIDKMIDIVSKNGNMLLNVPIKADGTIDATATRILKEIGRWFDVNGEAIYGTRPWYMFGEGPTNEMPHMVIKSPFKSRDIRFTKKGDTLYAFLMDWPKTPKNKKKMVRGRPWNEVLIQNLTRTNARITPVKSVELLGCDQAIQWRQEPDGLIITLPENKPASDFAYAFKIGFEKK